MLIYSSAIYSLRHGYSSVVKFPKMFIPTTTFIRNTTVEMGCSN